MVLERLDAASSATDNECWLLTYGKVAVVAVVGNEDGAQHTTAEIFQSLNDLCFTIPTAGATYWVSEAMQCVDYNEVGHNPTPQGRPRRHSRRMRLTETIRLGASHRL